MEYLLLLLVIYLGYRESLRVPKTARHATDMVDFILRG